MTEEERKKWLINHLRRITLRWPARNAAKQAARTERKINARTGRLAWHARCAKCEAEFPESQVDMDHVNPVVKPGDGFQGFTEWILGAFPLEPEAFQALCKECHGKKTKKENRRRRSARRR